MRKILNTLTVLTISSLLISCNNFPNEELAKTSVSEKISEISNKNVELIEFKKTNAQEQNMFGVEMHKIEFSGRVKYRKSGYITKYSADKFNVTKRSFLIVRDNVESHSEDYYIKVKENEIKDITGNVIFEKMESGWRPNSHFIKLTD